MKPMTCKHCGQSYWFYRCGCLGAEIEETEKSLKLQEAMMKHHVQLIEEKKLRLRELQEAKNAIDPVNQAIWRAFK